MAFLETPRFPPCVSMGAASKPRYKTNTIALASGYKSKNIEWAQALHSFEFSQNGFLPDEHAELLAFFHALQGAGNQFRVKDFSDYAATTANGVLIPLHGSAGTLPVGTVGLGYGAKQYLLGKIYAAGALSVVRWLQKPVSGTVAIYKNAVALTAGASPGNYAVDTATGKITLVADASRSITTHSVGTTHEVTFATAFSPNFTVGQRVYFENITGTAADALNFKTHAITYVSTSTIRVSTNTTGLTATGGNGYMFPQATDALTAACQFDVPCVFTSDEASFEIINKQGSGEFIYRWSGIAIEEDRIPL